MTPSGRKVLLEWLAGDPQLGDERYGFVAQFFFMDATGDWRETKRYVTALREVLAQRLEKYELLERDWVRGDSQFPDPESPSGFHQLMALRGGLYHMASRIKWCDDVIQRVESHIEKSTSSNRKTDSKSKRKTRRRQ